MSELNFSILQKNIRELIEKHDLVQNTLADIAGMSQSNLSKALNENEKKQFTLEQVFRISQHFGVSIDELVGNRKAEAAAVSPRGVLAFLVELLKTDRARVTTYINENEEVFIPEYVGYSSTCSHNYLNVEYPAIYFPSYFELPTNGITEDEYQELLSEFTQIGNDTNFLPMNKIIKKLLPIIELYKKKEIADEPFQMIVDGYLGKLRDR